MTISFTAIDFETANSNRGSICSVGLAKVISGSIVETRSWLISPPDGAEFDAFNTAIHGITAAAVFDAPDWPTSLRHILEFIGEDIIIAHNAAFDLGALRDACTHAGLPWPSLNYACTVVLARTILDLPVYKLPWVADALEIPSFAHHDARDDAEACALIAIELAKHAEMETIGELLTHTSVMLGRVENNSWSGCRRTRQLSASAARPSLQPGEIDPHGPMSGEVVCFTGKISWSRSDAQELVVRHGGTFNSGNPTRKTTLLVTGDYDDRSLRPGMVFGNKLARAFALVDQGQKLEIITERDFIQRLAPDEGKRAPAVQGSL